MIFVKYINKIYQFFLSDRSKGKISNLIFMTAIAFFIVHSMVIALVSLGVLPGSLYNRLAVVPEPLSAIYTPFSIILLYEIYLIIYYLPKSIKIYLGKQYEIIALILIRNIFDDLAKLSAEMNGAVNEHISDLLWTFGGLIVLLLLIFCFYKLSESKHIRTSESECNIKQRRFIFIKKVLSLFLLLLFVLLFFRSLTSLYDFYPLTMDNIISVIKEMSNQFFTTFFTVLIIVEVLLLLFMYDLDENFSKVIRNSGFIISTILLKLSFRVEDKANIVFILIAVAFGVVILGINRLYERIRQ